MHARGALEPTQRESLEGLLKAPDMEAVVADVTDSEPGLRAILLAHLTSFACETPPGGPSLRLLIKRLLKALQMEEIEAPRALRRGHQWSLVVISGHQWPSVAISGHQWSSVVISGHQWPSVVISGHQWSSVVISGHQWPSVAV